MSDRTRHLSRGPGQGKILFVLGDVVTFKVSGPDSEDAYSVVEIISPPGGGPSFLHTHIPQETFYIIEGQYEIYGQDESGKYAIPAPAGATVHVPAGVPHGFKNVSSTTGKLLAVYEPARPMLAFFEDIGLPMDDVADPPSMDALPDLDHTLAVMERHQMEVLEPPPV